MRTRVVITIGLASMLLFAIQVWGENSVTNPNVRHWGEFFGKPFIEKSTGLASGEFVSTAQNLQFTDFKSPKKAFLFSALLPGAGEFYAKSRLKSLMFFSFEVAAWAGYVYFHKDGKRQEDEYLKYADENWNEEKWWKWWNVVPEKEQNTTFASETLPDTKTQQYYEMIGKYPKFNAGWNDVYSHVSEWNSTNWMVGDTLASDKSRKYMDLRYWSNRALKFATGATIVALLNHVISALDAAWTAHRYNQNQTPVAVQLKYVHWEGQPQVVAELTLKW